MPNAQDRYNAFLAIQDHRGWKFFMEDANEKMNWYRWEIERNEMLSAEQMKNMQLILKGMRMIMNIPRQLEYKSKAKQTTREPVKTAQRR